MNFNKHYDLLGKHAFLSASGYHWINYDLDKLTDRYLRAQAVQLGTELHDLAANLISHGIRLPRTDATLNMYVNDAIGFKMTPEQPLYYSDNCFGTADAILFRKNALRIHDYKSGENEASLHQLEIYAALFCLEYRFDPESLNDICLVIYQNNEKKEEHPEPALIREIMEKIIVFDRQIEKIKAEG